MLQFKLGIYYKPGFRSNVLTEPVGLYQKIYSILRFIRNLTQILIKYPVIAGISQGMADGPALWSKSMG